MEAWGLAYWSTVVVQLLIATLCGGLIGYQRESLERPAGFRTHILVCVGSAIYMLVSVAVAGKEYDPGRIAAQVASGIGFLGAGTIIKQGSIVRGLTTAASLWAVAGIGLAAGYGGRAFVVAIIGTVLVFASLTVLRQFEVRLERNRHSFSLDITLQQPRRRAEWVQALFAAHGLEVLSIAIASEDAGVGDISIDGRTPSHEDLELVANELIRDEGVRSVRRQYR
ncbi:MAG TPA: MgtC/SapB family protein [Armatimonadota bacterium]|jgi:putative Mg2+ transporter-C (MgtC) family protein